MWLEELGPDLFIDLGFVGISFFFQGLVSSVIDEVVGQ
jgi:hypothetical protein